MPIYQNPKTNEEYELDEDFDVSTGVDRNREKALAKGYVPLTEVVNPKTSEPFAIPQSELGKATEKGYQIPALVEATQDKQQFDAAQEKAGIPEFGEVTPTESAIRGVTSAIPFTDELSGALKSPIGAAKSAIGYVTGEEAAGDDVDAYRKERDLQRARDNIAAQENPGAFYPAMGVGALATGGIGTGKTVAGKLAGGVAEGAALGMGAAEGENITEDAGQIAFGGAVGALPGVLAATDKTSRAATELVAGPKSGQFLDNPALIDQVEDPSMLRNLRERVLNKSRDAKAQIKEDISGLKSSSGEKYNNLRERLLQQETAPVDLGNSPVRGARDIFTEAQRARGITPDDKQFLDDLMMSSSSNEKRAVQLAEVPGEGRVSPTDSPNLTQGEAIEAVIQMKQELGNQINALTQMQKMGNLKPSEGRSLQILKEAQAKLNTVIDEAAETASPEIKDAYRAANQEYASYSNMRKTAKDAIGAKKINNNREYLSENKLRRLVESGDDDVRAALRSRLTPEANKKIDVVGEEVQVMNNLRQSRDDWNLIKNKVPLEGLPIASKVIRPSTAIHAYNKLRPALKAAIKALEQSGKPITLGVIEALAQQHNESVDNIQSALGEK